MGFMEKLFGTHSQRELKKIEPIVNKVMSLEDEYSKLTDEQLKLLASDGMLVKRPLLVTDEKVLTGFREAEWTEMLLTK